MSIISGRIPGPEFKFKFKFKFKFQFRSGF